MKNFSIWLAIIIMVIAYNFSSDSMFFLLNAIFITIICGLLRSFNQKSFLCFCLFCVSLNNLFDELFFDNTKLGFNELIFVLFLPLFWIIKNENIK